MNFVKVTIKIIIIFFWIFISFPIHARYLSSTRLDESGIPLIQKFPFPNFSLSSGKFSVYEDSSGIFLLGTKHKIIIFYGNEFISVKLKGQINILSDQKSIFYTGYNSLGLIKLYKNSQPQLIPLVSENLKSNNDFGQINNVYIANGLIIFNNNKKLFQFDGTNFSVIDSSNVRLQLFRVADIVYIYKYETGLYKFFMGKPVPVPYGKMLAKRTIEAILPYEKSLLIKYSENVFFQKLDFQGLTQVKFGFEDFIDKVGFSDAIFISDNKLAIGTKSAGVIIYDYALKIFRVLGMDEGLLANSVNNLFRDKAGNLWILHDQGISRIEMNVPVTEYGHYAGLSGVVNDIIKFKGTIYLATSNGLYKTGFKNISGTQGFSQFYFSKVEGIFNECLSFQLQENSLFVATPTGIYKFDEGLPTLILKENIYCFAKAPFKKDFFYIGNEQGLTMVRFSGNKFEIIGNNSLNGNIIVEISPENDSIIWLKSASNKLLMLVNSKKGDINKEKYSEFNKSDGLPTEMNNFHILHTSKGLKFCFPDSVFKFNYILHKFEPEEVSSQKYLKGIPWLVETITDRFENKWFHISSSIENLQGILMYKASIDKKSINPYFFNTGSNMSPIYIDSFIVWIGGDNRLLQFDNNKQFNISRNFSAIIKRMIIGKDSLLQIGLEDPDIKYKYNDIKFEVSSTCFEGEPYVRYQYKLIGYNQKWTNWSRENIIRFPKLSPGEYALNIRALNVDGTVSDITELKFNILHPFYLTLPAYFLYLFILLFLTFVLLRWRTWIFFKNKEILEKIVHERTEEILKEKEKSEILIANLLPKGTADELKSTGKATSQKFSMVTVLFSDIQGFTKIAEQMNPELLIDQLDAFFFHFDMVVEKYNIEKIKTIGDAYMCAGGIPNKNITNPVEVVLAALEMQEYMGELKSKNVDIWDLRIGIHTGSVIAGVVGHKKMSYDIWGDTVNTASRMESSGEAGKINISGHTYDLVKEFFICEHRGKMPVKYKGEIDMYFVKGIRPELAMDMRHIPNNKFYVLLQLLRLQDLEEDIFLKLSKELPGNLYFHNLARIKEVYNLVDLFGRAEEITDEDKLLLRTASLLHDVGYIWGYDNHEEFSINYAKEILPIYKYSQGQIDKINALIEVTKHMRKPLNKSEEILLDADMNYLSRADFITLNDLYYNESFEKGKISSREDWDKMQIVLLSNHKFYSNVANVLRDVNPIQQIENIIETSKKSTTS